MGVKHLGKGNLFRRDAIEGSCMRAKHRPFLLTATIELRNTILKAEVIQFEVARCLSDTRSGAER